MSERQHPTPFAEVNAVLHHFRAGIEAILENHFQGMYMLGSLALGDFDPGHSDIDMLVVTDSLISDDHFHRLQQLHADYAASGSAWVGRVEAVYVPLDALRRPNADLHPQIERGTALFRAVLENGWVFQCYTLRERALVVAGDDPRGLLDPISAEDMRPAVATIAGTWLEQAHHDPEWITWVRGREAQAFVVLTLCRMLYSLRTGAVISKPAAAPWGQTHLPERWQKLITDALTKRYETGEIRQSEVDEIIAFIRYTVEQSQSGNTTPRPDE